MSIGELMAMGESIQTAITSPVMTDDAKAIGARVRALRDRAKWSQEELSRRAGVPQATISTLETGDTSNPRSKTLARIAQAFAVPVESITGEAPIPGARPAGLADVDPLERALFRAYHDDRHSPSTSDAARRVAHEAGASLAGMEPDALAAELLDAAAALQKAGQPLSVALVLARALASRTPAKKRA